MSNTNPPDQKKEDDALAALHGLANSDESAEHEDHDEHHDDEHHDAPPEFPEDQPIPLADSDDNSPSSTASGFVGMLAKEGSAGAAGQGSGTPIRTNRDQIQMAREIELAPRDSAPAPFATTTRITAKKGPRKVPGWYHAAVPVMYTLGALLIFIGLWAVGALIYMGVTKATEAQPSYWWISRALVDEDNDIWSYTSGSKMMAISMLVCLPVSFVMGIMASIMQKQIKAADRAAGR